EFLKVNVGGELIKQWPVYRTALEVDKIINVPIAKHHSLSRLTIGMKNLYGLMGGRRNQLHQDVHLSIAEMTAFFAPTLTVVDAVRILVANGPSGGSLSDVKKCDTVIASVDPVAADARAAALFGITPAEIRYLTLGSEMGLGTLEMAEHQVREVRL
ncbi:MAG: cytoplasmic protein, partial [Deltaproteobacteria bacterium]